MALQLEALQRRTAEHAAMLRQEEQARAGYGNGLAACPSGVGRREGPSQGGMHCCAREA